MNKLSQHNIVVVESESEVEKFRYWSYSHRIASHAFNWLLFLLWNSLLLLDYEDLRAQSWVVATISPKYYKLYHLTFSSVFFMISDPIDRSIDLLYCCHNQRVRSLFFSLLLLLLLLLFMSPMSSFLLLLVCGVGDGD